MLRLGELALPNRRKRRAVRRPVFDGQAGRPALEPDARFCRFGALRLDAPHESEAGCGARDNGDGKDQDCGKLHG